jgi:hypothetical protein
MINNSTWIDPEHNRVFRFANDQHLSINGKNHLFYSLQSAENKIVLKLGPTDSYYVDYVNDFVLHLYNNDEKFRITPE